MKKSTLIGVIAVVTVAAVGTYLYVKSKQRKEDKYVGDVIDTIKEGSFTINIKK